MRIRDWSSDVCSSVLAIQAGRPVPLRLARGTLERAWHDGKFHVALPGGGHYSVALEEQRLEPDGRWTVVGRVQTRLGAQAMVLTRSEEHTSELQSLMRISYAVFCLKKKKKSTDTHNKKIQ